MNVINILCVLIQPFLFSYIKLYGHRFSKDDHVLFIKLALELIIAVDLDSQLLIGFCHLFVKLIK